MEFSLRLSDNILRLHRELAGKNYRHGPYRHAKINDPKPRDIHIASVRDRLLHHATYRVVYPYFDRTFIFDSYSCRRNKGTHRSFNRFREYARDASHNHSRTVWALKCDIRKFFASIDHETLLTILKHHIADGDVLLLLERVIRSFQTIQGKGLPLGNLTSQLLVNVYMNEFDQFVKHTVKAKHYIRYADDFLILSDSKSWLNEILPKIATFLGDRLKLSLHPDKVYIKTLASGIDFLGWAHFPDHRVLRTTTKRRMFKKLAIDTRPEVFHSYLGLLKHGNARKIKQKIYQM